MPLGLNLSEIQKAEKERRAHETAVQLQKQAQQEMQQQMEKQSGVQFNWAKKPVTSSKVKSFAEIQAEEQERLAKVRCCDFEYTKLYSFHFISLFQDKK